ncbi:MAG: adenylate kinase [Bacteroidales bacterium]
MFNLVMFGPPGAGKGTQSLRLAQVFQLKHISTGDILREEVRRESLCGKKAKEYMDKGMLVPDEVLINILKKVIDENRYVNGFVFDGFPRTLFQATELDIILAKEKLEVSMVLSLVVDEEELVTRLAKRAVDQGRTDDKPEVIRKRLETYHETTEPLLKYFMEQGKMVAIKGVGTVDEITKSLVDAITNFPS